MLRKKPPHAAKGRAWIFRARFFCHTVRATHEPDAKLGLRKALCPILLKMPNLAAEARFQPASDQSLLLYLGEKITLEVHLRIVKLLRLLESRPIEGMRNLHPAYCSLLIQFDPFTLDHKNLETVLR